jgi:protein MpaA
VVSDRLIRRLTVASILLVPLLVAVGIRAATADEGSHSGPLRHASPHVIGRYPSQELGASPPIVRRLVLGHSVLGRPVVAFHLGDPMSRTKVLVVGCIHGDECAGTAIARSLIATPPADIDLWVIRNLNPDGFRAGTRQNGHGVDLNRNFPYQWRPIGRPWSKHYSGPHPLSEPESRIARRLIARVHPDVSIWFHQPLGLVDSSEGDRTIERRFARRVGLPLVTLRRYPGSVTRWQNHWHPEASSFVVELPAGPLSLTAVSRYANAIVRSV